MSEQSGRGLPDSHLLPDAVVAFVDAELSAGAQERAAEHLAHCSMCVAEVSAQRQARTAVRGAAPPPMSAGFLASLRSIPDDAAVPGVPGVVGELAVSAEGQLVAVQRPDKVSAEHVSIDDPEQPGGSDRVLGPDGSDPPDLWRRTAQGAGVVVAGMVLSAIVLVVTGDLGPLQQESTGGTPQPRSDVMRAQFDVPGAEGQQQSDKPSTGTRTRSNRSAPTTTPTSNTAGAATVTGR